MSALPSDRREYLSDNGIPPLIELRIQKVVGDTRHDLRQDLATLGTQITTAQLKGSQEHAINLAALQEIKTSLVPLASVPERVASLERREDISDALRKSLWKVGTFIVLVLGAVNGIIITLVSH